MSAGRVRASVYIYICTGILYEAGADRNTNEDVLRHVEIKVHLHDSRLRERKLCTDNMTAHTFVQADAYYMCVYDDELYFLIVQVKASSE